MKKKLMRLSTFRMLLNAAGTLSLMVSAWPALGATDPAQDSPLLAQTAASQDHALKLINAIRSQAGGSLHPANAHAALKLSILKHRGVTVGTIAAALNQMSLKNTTLKQAVMGAGAGLKVPVSDVLAGMITHSYMNQGRQAAQTKIAGLRDIFGNPAIAAAMNRNEFASLLTANDLSGITPAAGDGSVYDG